MESHSDPLLLRVKWKAHEAPVWRWVVFTPSLRSHPRMIADHCRPWPTWNLAESEFVFLKVNAWKRLTITFPPAFLIHLWLLYTKQYASSSYWLSCYTQSISMCACCQHTHGRLFRLTLKLTRLFEWFTGIRCAERSYFDPSLILSHRWIFHETAIFIAIFTSNMLLPPCFSVGLISYSKFTFPTTELGTVNHCCISIIFWEPNATELFFYHQLII